jgi:hypothetical protein
MFNQFDYAVMQELGAVPFHPGRFPDEVVPYLNYTLPGFSETYFYSDYTTPEWYEWDS